MRKHYSWVGTIVAFFVMLIIGSRGYASDTGSHFQDPYREDRAYINPPATSYYDDLEDHYEQELLMLDQIGEGIDGKSSDEH
jgi:hypothetical protein